MLLFNKWSKKTVSSGLVYEGTTPMNASATGMLRGAERFEEATAATFAAIGNITK